MRSGAALGVLALAVAASAAHTEPIYVIEQLVVGVASAPDAEAERIGQVKSGDKLELIERQGEQAHVRLPNGKDGWVKASYLSTEEPLQHRLNERTAELEKLKQEGRQLKQDVSRLESELASSRLAQRAAAAPARAPARPNTPQELAPPAADAPSGGATPIRETLFLRSPDRPGNTPWAVVLGTAAVMLLVGFVLGWKTLDRRIRHKYGGLRIY